jgi:carboxypeptidase T
MRLPLFVVHFVLEDVMTKFWLRIVVVAGALVAALLWANGSRVTAGSLESRVGGNVVARVYYEEIADISKLAAYDVWEYNNLAEKYVLVGLHEEAMRQLEAEGWRVSVDEAATAEMLNVNMTETFNGGYRTVSELYANMDTMNAANPTITEVIDYGNSYCKGVGGCTTPAGHSLPGFDLRALRITNEAITGDKPTLFIMAAIHSREITTPELTMRFADWLVDGYGTDADATWLVDWHEIYLVPVTNPDGHWIVALGPYYQRKNANRSNGCSNFWPPSSSTHYGIDLNRNHTFGWNTGGSSNDGCNATYRGPFAGSEPEVAQLQNFVLTLFPDQRGPNLNDPAPANATGVFITLHSYGDLVLWPWGNITTAAPNKNALKAIGDKFATYNGYQSCQPSICLYITSGTSDDWAYGELGIAAYTFEVGSSFMPTYSTIDNVQWPENRPAFIYAAKIARTPYMTTYGPDALNVSASGGSGSLNVTATINDSTNGNNAVNQAVYYIDTPPWAGGTFTGNLNANDGSFNSPVEGVNGTIDVSGLSEGQHIIFVQGKDSGGNWGPFSAAFFEVASDPPPGGDLVYVSAMTNGVAGGVAFEDEDILVYDMGTAGWAMYFDGSDVGLAGTDVDAFDLLPDGGLLLSIDSATFTVPGLGTVEDRDVIKFVPTSTGTTTAGAYEWFLDGSDVGLTTTAEDIDAVDYRADGKVAISTFGNVGVPPRLSATDEDLLLFTPTSLGANTAGTWDWLFDGSDVGLDTAATEDVNGAWYDDASGNLYLTTLGAVTVTGLSGDGADIFICDPGTLGSVTACTFSMYWDGSANGFAGEVVDGFAVVTE